MVTNGVFYVDKSLLPLCKKSGNKATSKKGGFNEISIKKK